MAKSVRPEEKVGRLEQSGFLTEEIKEKAQLETWRAAMESAKDAIKAALLINGGRLAVYSSSWVI